MTMVIEIWMKIVIRHKSKKRGAHTLNPNRSPNPLPLTRQTP